MRNLFIRHSVVLFPSFLLHLSIIGNCLSHSVNWFCNKGRQVAGGFSRIPWCKEFAGIFPHTHTHYDRCPPPVWLLVPTFRNPRASVQVQVSPTVVHCCNCIFESTQERPIKKPSSYWAAYNTNWGAHFQAIWALFLWERSKLTLRMDFSFFTCSTCEINT